MSVEEDVELRDLVAQTLESNGCLAKIRAQLRASIFLALDEDIQLASKQPLLNNKIKTHLESPEGKIMFCIVREFLEYFNLCYTISVYDAESYLDSQYKFEGRQKLTEDLELDNFEDTTVPVLLQLIRIAQMKTKGIEIHMNMNGSQAQHDKSTSQENESDSSNIKTDGSSVDSQNEDKSSDDILLNNAIKDRKLNTTFNVNSPVLKIEQDVEVNGDTSSESSDKVSCNNLEINKNGNTLDTTYSKEKKEDTYEETSSSNDDSISVDNNIKVTDISNGIPEDYSLSISSDKSKSSQKPDKLKSKINLSSLTDLPPMQINKSRGTDILPSLYSKEFKDKSNLRELDKLFDMEVEYEEDFICSGDEFSLKSDYLKSDNVKLNSVDEQNSIKSPELQKSSALSMKDVKRSKSPTRLISDCNKPLFKTVLGNQKVKDTRTDNRSETGGSSSVSEHLEFETSE